MRCASHRKKVLILTVVGIGVAVLGNTIDPAYQVRFNPSESAPRGFYLFAPVEDIRVGSAVFVRLPTGIAGFAAARDYLPLGVPILKRIGAVAGQHVCQRNDVIWIDGKAVASSLAFDGKDRPMPRWPGCEVLGQDDLFLLSTHSIVSFDSRYFGPVSRRAVLARAIPLWTW